MKGEMPVESKKIWNCPAGSFRGSEEEGVIQIKGIRYAESKRFERPVPYRYPSGVHAMTEDAPAAVQLKSGVESYLNDAIYEKLPQEESCQYLSITLPGDAREGEYLPVMVWFHGGAFRNGTCDAPVYDRVPMVREGRVILVGVNYRLSLLGFMKEKSGEPANLGLFDLIESLKWIQENIACFGGDTDNVTIFGQSAGAEASRCIMLTPGTEHLWKRAILHSDPIGTMTDRKKMERKMLEELNTMPDDAPLDEVRRMQDAITKHVDERSLPRFMVFGPHIGVDPVPPESRHGSRLKEVMKDHQLMVGCTSREGAPYVGNNRTIQILRKTAAGRKGVETAVRLLSRAIFNDPGERFARQAAEAGGKVWYFDFYWKQGEHFLAGGNMMDLVPLFGGRRLGGVNMMLGMHPDETMEAGRPMRKIWTEFARTGEITSPGVDGMLRIRRIEQNEG